MQADSGAGASWMLADWEAWWRLAYTGVGAGWRLIKPSWRRGWGLGDTGAGADKKLDSRETGWGPEKLEHQIQRKITHENT